MRIFHARPLQLNEAKKQKLERVLQDTTKDINAKLGAAKKLARAAATTAEREAVPLLVRETSEYGDHRKAQVTLAALKVAKDLAPRDEHPRLHSALAEAYRTAAEVGGPYYQAHYLKKAAHHDKKSGEELSPRQLLNRAVVGLDKHPDYPSTEDSKIGAAVEALQGALRPEGAEVLPAAIAHIAARVRRRFYFSHFSETHVALLDAVLRASRRPEVSRSPEFVQAFDGLTRAACAHRGEQHLSQERRIEIRSIARDLKAAGLYTPTDGRDVERKAARTPVLVGLQSDHGVAVGVPPGILRLTDVVDAPPVVGTPAAAIGTPVPRG